MKIRWTAFHHWCLLHVFVWVVSAASSPLTKDIVPIATLGWQATLKLSVGLNLSVDGCLFVTWHLWIEVQELFWQKIAGFMDLISELDAKNQRDNRTKLSPKVPKTNWYVQAQKKVATGALTVFI